MNHKIYFSKTSKKLMSCVKFNVRATIENDRRRCWSSVATFVYDQQRSFSDTFGEDNWHVSQLDVREHYYQLRNFYFLSWNDQQWVEDNGLNSKIAFAIFEFKMAAMADRPFDWSWFSYGLVILLDLIVLFHFPTPKCSGSEKKEKNMIFILFLFTSLPTLQKWSGKDPGNYKSIKGHLSVIQSTTGSYHCCSRASDFRRYTSHPSGYRD